MLHLLEGPVKGQITEDWAHHPVGTKPMTSLILGLYSTAVPQPLQVTTSEFQTGQRKRVGTESVKLVSLPELR